MCVENNNSSFLTSLSFFGGQEEDAGTYHNWMNIKYYYIKLNNYN